MNVVNTKYEKNNISKVKFAKKNNISNTKRARQALEDAKWHSVIGHGGNNWERSNQVRGRVTSAKTKSYNITTTNITAQKMNEKLRTPLKLSKNMKT